MSWERPLFTGLLACSNRVWSSSSTDTGGFFRRRPAKLEEPDNHLSPRFSMVSDNPSSGSSSRDGGPDSPDGADPPSLQEQHGRASQTVTKRRPFEDDDVRRGIFRDANSKNRFPLPPDPEILSPRAVTIWRDTPDTSDQPEPPAAPRMSSSMTNHPSSTGGQRFYFSLRSSAGTPKPSFSSLVRRSGSSTEVVKKSLENMPVMEWLQQIFGTTRGGGGPQRRPKTMARPALTDSAEPNCVSKAGPPTNSNSSKGLSSSDRSSSSIATKATAPTKATKGTPSTKAIATKATASSWNLFRNKPAQCAAAQTKESNSSGRTDVEDPLKRHASDDLEPPPLSPAEQDSVHVFRSCSIAVCQVTTSNLGYMQQGHNMEMNPVEIMWYG